MAMSTRTAIILQFNYPFLRTFCINTDSDCVKFPRRNPKVLQVRHIYNSEYKTRFKV